MTGKLGKDWEVAAWQEGCTISTGKQCALVHSSLTVEPGVSSGTLAHVAVAVASLPAFATMEAGGVGTGQRALLAVQALKALGTHALVGALKTLPREMERKCDQACLKEKGENKYTCTIFLLCICLNSCKGYCHTPSSQAHS